MDIQALLKRQQPQSEKTDTVKRPRIDVAGPPSAATDGIYATPERVIASIMSKLVALSQGCVWYNVDSSREQMKTVLVCRYAASA